MYLELAPPNWAKKIIDNIMKNMVISIKNVNIYYEVSQIFTPNVLTDE